MKPLHAMKATAGTIYHIVLLSPNQSLQTNHPMHGTKCDYEVGVVACIWRKIAIRYAIRLAATAVSAFDLMWFLHLS